MNQPKNLHDAISGHINRGLEASNSTPERVAKAAHKEAVATRAQELRVEQEARALNASKASGIHTPAFHTAVAAHFTKNTK